MVVGRLNALQSTTIQISNPNGKWLNEWNGGELVEVFAEYADTETPSTKIYSGKLDNVFYSYGADGYKASLISRQTPEVADIKIVEQFDNRLAHDAIKTIIDDYFTGILTYNNVEDSSVTITKNYSHVSGMQAIADIALQSNMDLYIDIDGDVHLFEKESITNNTETFTVGTNIMRIPKYGKDTTKIFNNVTVYGKEDDNIIIVKTEKDVSSQTDLWRKDLIINDNSLYSMESVRERANVEIVQNVSEIEEEGSIEALGTLNISPGDMCLFSAPYCGINSYKKIQGYTHKISQSGFLTSMNIKDKQTTLADLFKERIDAENRLKPASNLNDMKNSYTVKFEQSDPPVTFTNCEVLDEVLQLSSGQTSGICTFNLLSTDEEVTQCELRVVTNYPQDRFCSYEVSADGGNNWESINPGTLLSLSNPGSQLTFRVNLEFSAGYNPAFQAICLLYK
jgi:hypothetical protein